MTRGLPCCEELFEHVVHELTLMARVHHFFVVGLFVQLQKVLREELERAIQIRFKRADRERQPPSTQSARRDVWLRGLCELGGWFLQPALGFPVPRPRTGP